MQQSDNWLLKCINVAKHVSQTNSAPLLVVYEPKIDFV